MTVFPMYKKHLRSEWFFGQWGDRHYAEFAIGKDLDYNQRSLREKSTKHLLTERSEGNVPVWNADLYLSYHCCQHHSALHLELVDCVVEAVGEIFAAEGVPANPWWGDLLPLRHPHLPRSVARLLLTFAGGEDYFLLLTPARGAGESECCLWVEKAIASERGEVAAGPNRRLLRDAPRLGQSLRGGRR